MKKITYDLLQKILIQIVFVALIWIFFWCLKNLVPNKWRPTDDQIRNLIKDFTAVSENFVGKKDDVMTILKKSKTIFDHFEEKNSMKQLVSTYEILNKYLELNLLSDKMNVVKDWTFTSLILPTVEDYAFENKPAKTSNVNLSLIALKFKINDTVEEIFAIQSYGATFENYFACSKNFDYKSLLNLVFDKFNNRIYIHINEQGKIVCAQLEQMIDQKTYVLDQKLFDQMSKEIAIAKKVGVQRSYLLDGLPGCGKTTFCMELSSRISGRVLKIDSAVFVKLAFANIKNFIESFNVDFIIVDDIDRIRSGDMASFFYCLEAVKNYSRKPTLLATSNNLHKMDPAILRPGRFEDIIQFQLPSKANRKLMILKLLEKMEVIMSEENLSKLVDVTNGLSNAYLKEYCFQIQAGIGTFEQIISKISQRKKLLDRVTLEEVEESESDIKLEIQDEVEYSNSPDSDDDD
jgi:hypothetical protein